MQTNMFLTVQEHDVEHELNAHIIQRLNEAATKAREHRSESSLYIYTFCVDLMADIDKQRQMLENKVTERSHNVQ